MIKAGSSRSKSRVFVLSKAPIRLHIPTISGVPGKNTDKFTGKKRVHDPSTKILHKTVNSSLKSEYSKSGNRTSTKPNELQKINSNSTLMRSCLRNEHASPWQRQAVQQVPANDLPGRGSSEQSLGRKESQWIPAPLP